MTYDPTEGLINGANLVNGLVQHGQATQDYVSGMFDQRAKLDAGRAVAGGDLEGAAGLLASRGDIEGAQALRTKAATTKSLKAYAGGDYAGAKQAAADAGDAPLLGAVTTDAEKEKADRAAWLGHAADALLQIKDPNRRQAAFQSSIVPTMKAMGLTDQQLSALGAQPLTDEGLNAFKAALGQVSKLTIHQDPNSGELLGVDPTGKVTVLHPGTRKPDWKPVKRADGSVEKYIDVNDPANQTDGGDAAPEPSGPVYDQIGSAAGAAGATPQEIAYLKRLGSVESSGNPKATNGASTGVFQFHPDTFARAGGGDINDVGDQTKAALKLSRNDRQALAVAGVQPTDANVYIMHQQGAGGGKALLTAPPEVGAVAALAPVYGGDETRATAAIAGNIGMPFKTAADKAAARAAAQHMTAGEFVDMWQNRWSGGPKASGGKSVAGDAPQADDGNLSDDAVEQAAERYITNGALPPMGMGKTGTQNRDKILNKAAEMEKATGRTGAEAVAAWAGVKANTATLADLTKTRGKVKSFEDNAVSNADLALSLAPKGAAPLNVPVINKWVQTGRKAVAGDPNVTQFDIALGTFLDEYAKITSGSTGGQGSTDASRREAYDRLSKYATQGQLAAGVATMKQEMGNRVAGLDKEIASTQAAISGGKGPPAPAATVAPRPDGWSKLLEPKQLATAKRFLGSRAPGGSQANPFVPTTQAQFDHLQPGQWFINPKDGQPMVKK